MNWHEQIAHKMGVKHSDTLAVVRWGKKAKRGTRRRERRLGRRSTRYDTMGCEMTPELNWTIGELKEWLAEHDDLDDDTIIILEKDAEGNGYSPLAAVNTGWYEAETTWSGEVWSDHDVVGYGEYINDERLRNAVSRGDLHLIDELGRDVRCVILGPVN